MQLKYGYILLTLLLFLSCNKNNIIEEEISILGYLYNNIPKKLPPPPQKSIGLDSSNYDINYSKHKPLHFTYAINEYFISVEIDRETNQSFFKYKTDKLFERENLDNIEMDLIKKINSFDDTKLISKKLLNKYVNESLLYLNQRFIDKKTKEEYKINGIISFSRVSFNKLKNRAAIAVGTHGGRLNSSLTIYILQKKNKSWKIKSYLTVEES